MERIALRPSAVLSSIAILCCSVVASAQSVDGFDPGANQTVWTVAVQPDGKTVFGGVFTGLGGGTGASTRNHIGRLNVDGTVDGAFNPGANGDVYAVAVQPDGKILVGGNFSSVGGGTGLTSMRSHIARLNGDGTVDLSFNPGANLNVYALAVQPDGKILVGGAFSTLGGATRIGLGRLNADGSVDSFNPGVSKLVGAPIVYTMALQPDGRIVVGGYFNGLGGGTGATTRNFIGRLNADGTLDTSFNPGANSISGINALALQADGKILVGGSFTGLGNGTGAIARQNIGRLILDGAVDLGFNPGAEAQVLTLAVQADGKILAGGYFKFLGGGGTATRKYLGRLAADGGIDNTFNPGAGNVVNALAVQADGAVVAGGIFQTVGGATGLTTTRKSIARFTNSDAAVQNVSLSGGDSVVTWARGGASPEVSSVTFEWSTNATTYTLLGSGTRVAGGWQLTGLSFPAFQRIYIRARGIYGTGFQNGSGSIIEAILIRQAPSTRRDGDFDGDGKADVAIYRPSNGTWYILTSGTGFTGGAGYNWGASGDVPVPGDYDGDGRTDVAVYRPSTAFWFIRKSSTNYTTSDTYQFGTSGDIPVPRDYDGDGRTDIAIYRPSNGTWFVQTSSSGFLAITWGVNGDVPLPGDYDGDGKADIAVYRPSSGVWYILKSSTSSAEIVQFGTTGDIPVPGDYDGDGKADIAVYRPSAGTWYIQKSSSGFVTYAWGATGDTPVPGDYDGDGRIDIAVYRPATAHWFIIKSSTNYTTWDTFQWGSTGDIPLLKRP